MTRINCTPPRWLLDQALLAEYREAPRAVGDALRCSRRSAGATRPASWPKPPPDGWRLGAGHVRWHAAHTSHLRRRHAAVVAELQRRGYRLQHTQPLVPVLGACGPFRVQPTRAQLDANLQRLHDRLQSARRAQTYCGRPAPTDWYARLQGAL